MSEQILFIEHNESLVTDKAHCGECEVITDKAHCGECEVVTDKAHCGECEV